MGRKKIEMKLVKKSNSRQVTFSKRRNGIFKKAHELATLCAIEILLVIFSPGGKPYSFGHPSVESVMQRFFDQDEDGDDNDDNEPTEEDKLNSWKDVNVMNKKFSDLLGELKVQKDRGESIQAANKAKGKSISSLPIEKQSREELRNSEAKLKELREDLREQFEMLEAAASLLQLAEKPVLASDLPDAK